VKTTKVMGFGIVLLGLAGCAVNGAPAPYGALSDDTVAVIHANPSGNGETVSAKIDNAAGGTVELSNGTKIEVPAGALPPGVDTITVTSSMEPAPVEYKTASPVYTFGPEGAVFAKPLKVSIPMRLPAGKSLSEMSMLWSRSRGDGFDMVPTEFVADPSIGGSAFVAIGEVTHFSKGMCAEKFVVDPRPVADAYAD
jgi:hypothetical protein